MATIKHYKRTANYGATVHETKPIVCEEATLSVENASTMILKNFTCEGKCAVHVLNASTLRIDGGEGIGATVGDVAGFSTGIVKETVGSDQVEVAGGSTWQVP